MATLRNRRLDVVGTRCSEELADDPPTPSAIQRTSLIAVAGLACLVVLMYGRSITLSFVADDWFLVATSRQLPEALAFDGTYHFNPVTKSLILVSYQFFGMDVIGYHLVALTLFWLASVLVLMLGRRLTNRTSVGVLSAVIYIAYGTQYEAAIWGVVAYYQTLGTVLSLVGMLLYARACDNRIDERARARARAGFIAAVIVSPFAYEQTIVLVFACMLYRLLVIEQGISRDRSLSWERLQAWKRDFAIPLIFLACYIALKSVLAHYAALPQLPGFSKSIAFPIFYLCLGLYWAFIPALSVQGALWLTFDWLDGTGFLYILVLQSALLAFVALVLKPLYRFLLLWLCLLVLSLVFGLGAIASRHLLLITVPAAILWACLLLQIVSVLERLLTQLGVPRRLVSWSRLLPSMGIVAAILVSGFAYAQSQEQAWAKNANRLTDLVRSIGVYAAADHAADTVYLVNLPDSDVTPTGETTYLFRNATPVLMSLAYPGRFKTAVSVRTKDYGFAQDYSVFASQDQLRRWSEQPGVLVLVYDEHTGTIQRLAQQHAACGNCLGP